MKGLIATALLLLAASAYGQTNKKGKPEVVRDSFGQFAFNESSIVLTQDGLQQLEKFGDWYLSHSKGGLYHVYISGLVTELELQVDSFLGVKRCKIVVDSLAKRGVDISFFFITKDKTQGGKEVGVGFVIDTKSRAVVEPVNEDDYFKDNKGNRKKG